MFSRAIQLRTKQAFQQCRFSSTLLSTASPHSSILASRTQSQYQSQYSKQQARSFAKLNKDDAEEEEEVEVTLDSFEPVMSLEWHEDPGIGGDTLPDPLTFDERLRDFSQAYTRFQRVTEHTQEDVGKFYNMGEAAYEAIPPQLTNKHFKIDLDYCGPYLMVRQEGFDLVQQMKKLDGSDAEQAEVAGRTYGIVGKKQRGKTCVLNYAVQYAKENEWLTVAVKPRDFYYDIPGFIVESKHSETLYDQPLGSAKFFANLRDTESAQLKKVVLKQTYSHLNWVPDLTNKVGRGTDDSLLPIQLIQSEYDASRHGADVDASSLPTDRTLFDLVALAAVDETQSADILYSFIEELKMTTEVPVVVAIDNFNEFDLLSEFVRPNNPHMRIPSRRLSLCKSFVDLAHHNPAIASSASSSSSPDSFSPLANGVVLFAHTASGQSVRHMVADLECATPVEVTRCTDSETENAFLHYKASNKMYAGQDKIADPNWMGEKRMLTQGIFGEVSFMAGLH